MIKAGVWNIEANRWTPLIYTVAMPIDLTGAALAMEVRLTPDTPGAALISLSNSTEASQGLSYTVGTVDGITTSLLRIYISEATMALLPEADELGNDLRLSYDIQITPPDGIKMVWLRGVFLVRAGVTQ